MEPINQPIIMEPINQRTKHQINQPTNQIGEPDANGLQSTDQASNQNHSINQPMKSEDSTHPINPSTHQPIGCLRRIWLSQVYCSLFPTRYIKSIPTHEKMFAVVNSGPNANLPNFSWVGEFVDFIIMFVCFPAQQNLVSRKHTNRRTGRGWPPTNRWSNPPETADQPTTKSTNQSTHLIEGPSNLKTNQPIKPSIQPSNQSFNERKGLLKSTYRQTDQSGQTDRPTDQSCQTDRPTDQSHQTNRRTDQSFQGTRRGWCLRQPTPPLACGTCRPGGSSWCTTTWGRWDRRLSPRGGSGSRRCRTRSLTALGMCPCSRLRLTCQWINVSFIIIFFAAQFGL